MNSLPRSSSVGGVRGPPSAAPGVSMVMVPVFFLVFPMTVSFGGSTDLLNWGPGILVAGLAALLLLIGKQGAVQPRRDIHGWLWLSLLLLLAIRALVSPGAPWSAIASDTSLIALASLAYMIGKSAGPLLARALFAGLATSAVVNAACIGIQAVDPEWNLIYPQRSGGFPSGLFAHYNYCAAFCIGALGLLVSRSVKERGWLRWLMLTGAFCALASVPLTLSRGGNLALATMAAISIVLLLAHGLRRVKSLLSLSFPVLALLPVIVIAGAFLVPMLDRNHGADGFYQDGGRVSFWQAALELAAESPWVGGGADSFSSRVYLVMADLGAEPDKAHNEALQLAVDYGYPALILIALLIGAPLFRSFWRFLDGSDSKGSAWESIGLVGMLVQSNFSFVFHTAPGVILAGIILGRISCGMWSAQEGVPGRLAGMGEKEIRNYQRFLIIARNHANEHLGGSLEVISKIISHLATKKEEEPWLTYRYNLLFFTKTKDAGGLANAVLEIKSGCTDLLLDISRQDGAAASRDGPLSGLARGVVLFVYGAATSVAGVALSIALVEAWVPVYHGADRLSKGEEFERILSLREKHPYLGLERRILISGLECIYQFRTAEAREYWAEGNHKRIERAVAGSLRQPGSALHLACIHGWAGDVDAALDLYDRAIAAQGNNEALFRAHASKGQYYHELALAASRAGQPGQASDYAKGAVTSLQLSRAALTNVPWKFSAEIAAALTECQQLSESVMPAAGPD